MFHGDLLSPMEMRAGSMVYNRDGDETGGLYLEQREERQRPLVGLPASLVRVKKM